MGSEGVANTREVSRDHQILSEEKESVSLSATQTMGGWREILPCVIAPRADSAAEQESATKNSDTWFCGCELCLRLQASLVHCHRDHQSKRHRGLSIQAATRGCQFTCRAASTRVAIAIVHRERELEGGPEDEGGGEDCVDMGGGARWRSSSAL